ncbi:MAG TPA: GNAT family N-acetyltransferase [Armatimonadota bacterium]|jgi:ribosomal protein S18 acetylase RimI-like enzyme
MKDSFAVKKANGETLEIALRPARDDEKDFCRQVHHLAYHDVVERQFGRWDEGQQDALFHEVLHMPHLQIIEVNGQRAGGFRYEAHEDHFLLAEIQLLPAFQGQAIGTGLIRQLQNTANTYKLPLRLRVLKGNRARILYQRLGFKATGEDPTHYLMEWTGN